MIYAELRGCDEIHTKGLMMKARGMQSVIPPFARKLIETGYSEYELMAVYRKDVLIFAPTQLSWWADRTISETMYRPLTTARYNPFPKAMHELAPLVSQNGASYHVE